MIFFRPWKRALTSINEHSKDLKSEVCLEGYDLFSPLERFIKVCFLGSLS